MLKMKKCKAILVCLALSLLFSGSTFAAETDVPRFQMANGYSVSSDGTVSPYTYYINTIRTTISANGSTLNYTLHAGCVRPIRHIQARAVVQRYTSSGWTNYVTAYYHAYNDIDLDVSDSVSNVPTGQYRVVVDYTAEDTYNDYVYDESSTNAFVF